MNQEFYKAYEDRWRGERESIRKRLEVYLPFVKPVAEHYPEAAALDIGCGRGEWLEVLREYGISGIGIDINPAMLAEAEALGLRVEAGDGIAWLAKQPEGSLLAISAIHVIEHIPFEALQQLMSEARRVLVPGGVLILETPNPENIVVATESFYMDPTHLRPVPSARMAFLAEYHGFARHRILRLQEDPRLKEARFANIGQLLEGVSPDYALVAQKEGPEALMARLDEPFARRYGLSRGMLVEKVEARMLQVEQELATVRIRNEQLRREMEGIGSRMEEVLRRAETMAREAEALHREHQAVLQSLSWRLTAPLRHGKRLLKGALGRLRRGIASLRRLPSLPAEEAPPQEASDGEREPQTRLSPRGREILEELKRMKGPGDRP